jgi:hypothetical protein
MRILTHLLLVEACRHPQVKGRLKFDVTLVAMTMRVVMKVGMGG